MQCAVSKKKATNCQAAVSYVMKSKLVFCTSNYSGYLIIDNTWPDEQLYSIILYY